MKRRAVLLAAAAFPFVARGQACTPTPEDIEGPFYKAGAPLKGNLYDPKSTAPKLVLSGVVMSKECKPLENVALDFWHADDKGEYDNAGYRYRGIVVTDSQGRYRLETNLPPPYSGRPRHVHVKLQRIGAPPLTTQLYFPGEARGENRALVLRIERSPSETRGRFDFVI